MLKFNFVVPSIVARDVIKMPIDKAVNLSREELKYAMDEIAMEEKFTNKLSKGKPQYSEAEVEKLMDTWRDMQFSDQDDDVSSDSEF